jgi:hypothetical protein
MQLGVETIYIDVENFMEYMTRKVNMSRELWVNLVEMQVFMDPTSYMRDLLHLSSSFI